MIPSLMLQHTFDILDKDCGCSLSDPHETKLGWWTGSKCTMTTRAATSVRSVSCTFRDLSESTLRPQRPEPYLAGQTVCEPRTWLVGVTRRDAEGTTVLSDSLDTMPRKRKRFAGGRLGLTRLVADLTETETTRSRSTSSSMSSWATTVFTRITTRGRSRVVVALRRCQSFIQPMSSIKSSSRPSNVFNQIFTSPITLSRNRVVSGFFPGAVAIALARRQAGTVVRAELLTSRRVPPHLALA